MDRKTARRVLAVTTEDRAGCSAGTVLDIRIGVSVWNPQAERPEGLGVGEILDDLCVFGNVYSDHPEWGVDAEVCGRSLNFPSTNTLRGLAKLATSIEAKLAKISKQYGPPPSFGAAALRFARVCNADGIALYDRESRTWSVLDAPAIAYRLDGMIADFRKRFVRAECAA